MNAVRLSSACVLVGCLLAAGPQVGSAQTVVFSDGFDPADCSNPTNCGGSPPVYSCGGRVDHSSWLVVPGKVNGYAFEGGSLPGSDPCHRKNHTGSVDGSMGDVSTGGSAFEVNADPYIYGMYRDFSAQTHAMPNYWSYDLSLSGWVWDDVESLCGAQQWWPSYARIGGGIGITSAPGEMVSSTKNCGSGDRLNEIYAYADYAFIGIEADPYTDTYANYYKWRTKSDESPVKWHLALDVNGQPIPRRPILQCPHTGPQAWRHLQIVVHPYTGNLGDVEFYIDGVKVGQGHRSAGPGCQGVDFQRVQLGARFPEQSDVDACKPPYSYEHLWFDDVSLATSPPAALPCANPQLRYDTDNDGDVDMIDFAAFQRCYTPNIGADCSCRCMDSNGDGAVAQADLNALVNCASGEGVPADVACESGLTPP